MEGRLYSWESDHNTCPIANDKGLTRALTLVLFRIRS